MHIYWSCTMRLTAQSDYALRMLMQIAVRDPNLVTISDVSETYGLSKNHLMKVAQALGQMGAVTSIRGRHGGLKLGRTAHEITVGEVVRELESNSALVECFQAGKNNCLVSPSCRLKSVLHEAMQAFYSVLDTYTLDDLIRKNSGLEKLLESAL